jgi:hypothetical protein
VVDHVRARLFGELPDETSAHLGHEGHGRDVTIGAERAKLAEWRERGW